MLLGAPDGHIYIPNKPCTAMTDIYTKSAQIELQGCFAPFWKPQSKVFHSVSDNKKL